MEEIQIYTTLEDFAHDWHCTEYNVKKACIAMGKRETERVCERVGKGEKSHLVILCLCL